MSIDNMIEALITMRNKVGGDCEVAVVRTDVGENDYLIPEYPVVGEYTDQDGNGFNCAFVANKGGEEFGKKGIPHYEWKPKDDMIEIKKNTIPFMADGYVHADAEELKKYPEPKIVDMRDKILHIKMEMGYWEDAIVNGIQETEDECNVPGYSKSTSSVDWDILIDSGMIINWKKGTTATIYYKVVDSFYYDYNGFHYGPNYVPDFMAIDDAGYGDYVYVTVDENGMIKNWNKDRFLKGYREDCGADRS